MFSGRPNMAILDCNSNIDVKNKILSLLNIRSSCFLKINVSEKMLNSTMKT